MFKKKNPTFEYESSFDFYPNIIQPSVTSIPQWYKDTPRFTDNKIGRFGTNATFKLCSPFLESLTIGYQLLLPTDMICSIVDGFPELTWKLGEDFAKIRESDTNKDVPIPHGYLPFHYIWLVPGSFKVPEGYSFIFTHPLNRNDLPFYTLTGVVDGNYAIGTGGNVPFFIKEGFEGIIPQGTPIAQIIPFKNEKWELIKKEGLVEEGKLNARKSSAMISGWYKRNIWRKKQW